MAAARRERGTGVPATITMSTSATSVFRLLMALSLLNLVITTQRLPAKAQASQRAREAKERKGNPMVDGSGESSSVHA